MKEENMSAEINSVKKKKRSKGWLTLVALALIAAGIFAYTRFQSRQTALETIQNLQTTPYSRETLISTISGTGSVRPLRTASLIWQTNGTVGNVSVEVGQMVEEDQLLVSLEENNLPVEILQAQLSKITAEKALSDLEKNVPLQRANLQNNINNTHQIIEDLHQQIKSLQDRECAEWRIYNLQSDYDTALTEYQDWPTEIKWSIVMAAKSALDFCDPAVIENQTKQLEDQIQFQETTIDNLQNELDLIKDGPASTDKETLQLQLMLAEKQLSNQWIKAAFDATVVSIKNKSGDLVTPGALSVQLADLSKLLIDVPISEVDIPEIQIGQEAKLVFDAFFEETYTGVVYEIARVGEDFAGVVTYKITIEMQTGIDKVKPGMTAGVSILTNQKENTFVVPSEAVMTRDGEDIVYVLRNEKAEAVKVKVGAYSEDKIEILEGDIQEGEAIILNPPSGILELFRNFR